MPERVHRRAAGASGVLETGAARSSAALGMLALCVLGWSFLLWLALDMDHPLARLAMPASPRWSLPNALAIGLMWALMMAAMMLPSAWPMVRSFVRLSLGNTEPARAGVFVAAYLVVWSVFSVVATAAQWALQAIGWVDPMIVSTSAWLTGLLLLVAGVYQFSPLKNICLSRCRSPMGFLLGQWRPGLAGAWVMGLRHGLSCVGCCWALMALLFVGGVMNIAWVAALSLLVAVEKLAPGGQRLAQALGLCLVAAGVLKLMVLVL